MDTNVKEKTKCLFLLWNDLFELILKVAEDMGSSKRLNKTHNIIFEIWIGQPIGLVKAKPSHKLFTGYSKLNVFVSLNVKLHVI